MVQVSRRLCGCPSTQNRIFGSTRLDIRFTGPKLVSNQEFGVGAKSLCSFTRCKTSSVDARQACRAHEFSVLELAGLATLIRPSAIRSRLKSQSRRQRGGPHRTACKLAAPIGQGAAPRWRKIQKSPNGRRAKRRSYLWIFVIKERIRTGCLTLESVRSSLMEGGTSLCVREDGQGGSSSRKAVAVPKDQEFRTIAISLGNDWILKPESAGASSKIPLELTPGTHTVWRTLGLTNIGWTR